MKKSLYLILSLVVSITSASAQSASGIAAWDFVNLGASGLDTAVDGYQAEKVYFNNGFNTSGSISSSLDSSNIKFSANGSAAAGTQLSAGLSTVLTANIGGAETGQQSINVFSAPVNGTTLFTLNFTEATDVSIYFDHAGVTTGTADFLDFNVNLSDGSTQTYTGPILGGSGWQDIEDAGAYGFFGKPNGVVTLSALAPSSGSIGITSVDFVLNANNFGSALDLSGTRMGFDNIYVEGVVVPEPSTYALVFGTIALLLVYRRKK